MNEHPVKEDERCEASCMLPTHFGTKAIFRCHLKKEHKNDHQVLGISEIDGDKPYILEW